MNIPSREQCLQILKDNKTPSNIIEHCKAVAKFAGEIAEKLIKKGRKVNRELVVAGALLHDIERHKDNHVARGAELVKKLGYPEVAEVVSKHTLYKVEMEENQPKTFEEKIVFYADKMVKNDKVVSLEERYDDIRERYGVNLKHQWEMEFTKKIEKELTQQ